MDDNVIIVVQYLQVLHMHGYLLVLFAELTLEFRAAGDGGH